MFKKFLSLCIVSTFSVAATSAIAQPNQLIGKPSPQQLAPLMKAASGKGIKNQYIVVLKQPATIMSNDLQAFQQFTQRSVNALANKHALEIKNVFDSALSGFSAELTAEQLQALRADPNVDYIEQNQIITVNPIISASANAAQDNVTWGIDRIDQRDLPLNRSYNYNYDGSGVTAYVIDTGIAFNHPEFGGRAKSGYDFIDNDNDARDCQGHGTHVAGTIGGAQYGVAKNVNLVGVRVLGCDGSGSTEAIVRGIDWVAQNASGPSVANLSLGGGVTQAMDQAVARLVQRGVNAVIAAGNDNKDACQVSPAREPSGITVGSTTNNDGRSNFSNWGNCVQIFAPGSDVTSASHEGGTKTMSGTSMATPHVAGVVALYLQENKNLSPNQIKTLLSDRSTKGKVSDTRGTTNKLLYSLTDNNTTPNPEPNPQPEPQPQPDSQLTNGKVVTGISGKQGELKKFYIDVPAGRRLSIETNGGTGNLDLYVRLGREPEPFAFDCKSVTNGNNETCTFTSTREGRHFITLYGTTEFNNVSLVARY
ncbi:S8 family peptidase [Vibrio cholerae]|uniref:S8 family peptidase n=1 Tax=Vibrio cholerae TaxID=666 RepID=A0A5C9T4C7_VIBCL|nr:MULTISPECIES: S8 family peptidase [Vibrio]EKG91657.1 extracellular subtilisin-like serine proteinase [Vibrio paracholerae HE-16]ELJ8548792.1 S8 family peptidase [Vibrio cholerae]ELY5188673.1 S8 family peptidase [Vibrio cholerae]ELY5288733.1 S8 family peptidase [Vibrio cholerae]MBW5432335.1 S8 family serine peptidase [Vibrio cholerae]